jgi:hypothetical protein
MGDESGGGGGPSGADVRGQVGLTKKEQNARAVAQERGGRQSAGVAKGSMATSGSGTSTFGDSYDSPDSFTTSTEGAERDLYSRSTKGQISQRVQDIPIFGAAATALNEYGKKRASDIAAKIEAGGTRVYDTKGRIQGVVSKNALGFDVYTGGSAYNPIGNPSARLQQGMGYISTERGAFGGGGAIGSTSTAATSTNVTGSTTSLSSASRRLAAQGASGGATTRRFL